MKVYVISHETRDEGVGKLNANIYKSYDEALKEVERCVGYAYPTTFSDMGWVDKEEYCDEDNVIFILERELWVKNT